MASNYPPRLCFLPWRNPQEPKMIKALFGRKKTTRPFKDYHAEWLEILKTTFVPLLSHSLSSSSSPSSSDHLADHVSLLHSHFQSYYAALDLAAVDDVSQILHPDWRNPLEIPFLFLGDFHPNIFTNLLRSFLKTDDDGGRNFSPISENFRIIDDSNVWRNPSETLTSRIEQIECGLRLMVPSLVTRAREAQTSLVVRLAAGGLAGSERRRRKEEEEEAVGDKVMETIEELTCVVLDANRLRRSVLAEILGAINDHQSALFLLALAQFVVGFRDADLLSEFKRCKIPLG